MRAIVLYDQEASPGFRCSTIERSSHLDGRVRPLLLNSQHGTVELSCYASHCSARSEGIFRPSLQYLEIEAVSDFAVI